MTTQFRQVALVGKYHAAVSGAVAASTRAALEDIAHFLGSQGCDVVVERDTAASVGIAGYTTLDLPGIGAQCNLVLVVGESSRPEARDKVREPTGCPSAM